MRNDNSIHQKNNEGPTLLKQLKIRESFTLLTNIADSFTLLTKIRESRILPNQIILLILIVGSY